MKPGKQVPALGILPELAHLYNQAFDPNHSARTASPDPRYTNKEEKYVIDKIETPAAVKLGQGTRNNHGGTPYELAGPTTTLTKKEIADIIKRIYDAWKPKK